VAQTVEFRLQPTTMETAQPVVLRQGRNLIGRQPDNDLYLPDDRVSRKHAEIICSSTECWIIDLASANGVMVNGERLTPNVAKVLAPDDLIEIAEQQIIFKQVTGGANQPPSYWVPLPPTPTPRQPYGLPPGLARVGYHLLAYLPEIYRLPINDLDAVAAHLEDSPDNFLARFLGIFESILWPISWNIANFDLFLHASTAPPDFLPWLATWFTVTFDGSWDDEQRRMFLCDAHKIYALSGTRWSVSRVLEIYLGEMPVLHEFIDEKDPFIFQVKVSSKHQAKRQQIAALIDAHKPANTVCRLEFT